MRRVSTVARSRPLQPVVEPVGDGFSDGVAASALGQAVVVVADQLLELGPGLGLGPTAGAPDDAFAGRGVADGDGGDPALPRLVPMQSAVAAATPAVVTVGLALQQC